MNKIKYSNKKFILLTLMFFLVIGQISVYAADKSCSPQDVLKQYFLAYQSKNIDLTSSLSNDSRFESENEEKLFLKEIFNDNEQDLKQFEVLDLVSESNDSAIVKGRVSLGNGEIFDRAFVLNKIDGKWTVMLSDTIPNKEHFKQIKQSNKEDGGLKQFEGEEVNNYNSEVISE